METTPFHSNRMSYRKFVYDVKIVNLTFILNKIVNNREIDHNKEVYK